MPHTLSKPLILQIISDEPEMPGEMPQAFWEDFCSIRHDSEAVADMMRCIVRLTKEGISKRILEI